MWASKKLTFERKFTSFLWFQDLRKNKLKLPLEWPNQHKKKKKKERDKSHYCNKIKYKVNFKCCALCEDSENLHYWPKISTEVFLTTI